MAHELRGQLVSGACDWALDPWSEEVLFLPVPGAIAVFRIPKAPASFAGFRAVRYEGATLAFADCYCKPYASDLLGWRGDVWVMREDEARLLAALQAAERVILALAALTPRE